MIRTRAVSATIVESTFVKMRGRSRAGFSSVYSPLHISRGPASMLTKTCSQNADGLNARIASD